MEKNPFEIDFEEYIRHIDSSKKEKTLAWSTAIGLQQVDGLTPSKYLIEVAKDNIEGKISIDELVSALGRTPRSIGANVTDLTKKGLAIREKVAGEGEDAKDITFVVLTDEGAAFVPATDAE